jgi:SAM-dependent methyltransferase
MSTSTIPRSAQRQGALWSRRADDWASIQEAQGRPVFEAALETLGVGAGTRLLDVGCGAGLALRMAADRGAEVAGLDASEALLEHARRRVPGAPILQGELEELPFDAASFDVVSGFNSFQYAAQPVNALREARRVLAPGGRVALVVWSPPEHCEAAAYLVALGSLMPPPPPGAGGPFALSGETALAALVDEAGFDLHEVTDVPCEWEYANEPTAVAGLLCAGPVVAVMEHAGDDAVREVTSRFLEPFRTSEGGYRISNHFRVAIATP